MFQPTSRYNTSLPPATVWVTDPDGMVREICYMPRRIIPPVDSQAPFIEHIVTQGERLDTIAARYLGDPMQFWRICDANNVMSPNDLTDNYGKTIKITLPRL